jgi:hypothetical protein
MIWFSLGIALLASLGIIAIGVMYLTNPRAAVRSFGLPLPEAGPHMDWWLRLKGVRDVVAGLVVLAMMIWAGPRIVGLVLLIQSFIAVGDMSIILTARGSVRAALTVHGLTAALMIIAAIPLLFGLA